MVNKPKRIGSAWEVAVVKYFQANGFPDAERRVQQGINDRGDVSGVRGVCLELKAERKFDLGGWIAELTAEKKNADAAIGVVIAKRRNHTVAKSYSILETEDLLWLLQKALGVNQP